MSNTTMGIFPSSNVIINVDGVNIKNTLPEEILYLITSFAENKNLNTVLWPKFYNIYLYECCYICGLKQNYFKCTKHEKKIFYDLQIININTYIHKNIALPVCSLRCSYISFIRGQEIYDGKINLNLCYCSTLHQISRHNTICHSYNWKSVYVVKLKGAYTDAYLRFCSKECANVYESKSTPYKINLD